VLEHASHPRALEELRAQRREIEVARREAGDRGGEELAREAGTRHVDDVGRELGYVAQRLADVEVHRGVPAEVLVDEQRAQRRLDDGASAGPPPGSLAHAAVVRSWACSIVSKCGVGPRRSRATTAWNVSNRIARSSVIDQFST